MDAFAIALGLKSGDEPPDPAKLAEELERTKAANESAAEARAARSASVTCAWRSSPRLPATTRTGCS